MSAVTDALGGLDETTQWQEELKTQEIGGGVVGVLASGDGRSVLFRAEIDALLVTETTGPPYASTKKGVMHACGHDTHIACALGAAELLAQTQEAWTGTSIALFQPAEELSTGAQSMVDAGLVDKVPTPTACLARHVLTMPEAGHVGTTAGPVFSAGDFIKGTLFGKGSHGAMPHLGIDPVVLASIIVVRLQTIVSRVGRVGSEHDRAGDLALID